MKKVDFYRNVLIPKARIYTNVGHHLVNRSMQTRPAIVYALLKALNSVLNMVCTDIGSRAIKQRTSSFKAVNDGSLDSANWKLCYATYNAHKGKKVWDTKVLLFRVCIL